MASYTSTTYYVGGGSDNIWAYLQKPVIYTPPIQVVQARPVTPLYDPKLEANALYGKAMALFAGGFARIGASPAPIVGPYIHDNVVDFIVSFGVPANVAGERKIWAIWLDNELAWSSTGGGTLPGHGTFKAESFDFIFQPGTLTQPACSLETRKFPGDECAYRPQMLLQIMGIPYARFVENTGKPVPYVACDIGDTTGGVTTPQDGINLGDALSQVAMSPWAGYTAANFECTGITDVVGAILIKDNFTVTELCQSVAGEYRNIEVLLSDKLRVKDRGSVTTPDFLFDRNMIIGGDEAVTVVRAGATEQKREHELVAIDPDQDYTAVPSLAKIPREPFVISAAVKKDTATLPLVIDANTRQALATFAQQWQENSRRKVTLKVRAAAYAIEPGDMFALVDIADGFDNEVFKCTQTSHGANYVVDVEGEAILRCSIFGGTDPDIASVVLLLHCNGTPGDNVFFDSSSYLNPVGVFGFAEVSATSKFGGGAMLSSGTTDGLVTDGNTTLQDIALSPTNTSPYTIECWAYFNEINRVQILVAMDQGLLNRFFRLKQNGDDELMYEWDETGASFSQSLSTTGADITIGRWIFIAVDKDSTGKIRIWVDGVMKASSTPANSKIGIAATAISVGCSGLAAGSSFAGLLDDIRITRGKSRYGDFAGDASFPPPVDQFPDT